jgi:general secretion pathway protein F
MPRFRYKAVNGAGEVQEGELDAASESEAVRQLQSMGLLPIRAEEAKASNLRDLLSLDIGLSRRGLSRREVMLFTRELATLLDAGIELERAFDILQLLSERESVQRVLAQILDEMRGGSTLADTLSRHPGSFSNMYVSLVRAGEAGGALDAIVARLAVFLEQSESVKEEVKSALIYPMVLLGTALLSVVVLVGFVLPSFKPLFDGAGKKLPVPTQIVMAVGEALSTHWWVFLLGFIVVLLGMRIMLRTETGRLRWDAGILRLPVFGGLVTGVETARLSRTLGTLLGSGVAMLPALEIAGGTVNNQAYRTGLAGVGDAVKSGKRLSDELAETDVFPELGGHLVRVGEESGKLDVMLLKIADIYEQDSRRSVQRLLAILTPVMTILLGALVAGIISSILLAILSINEIAF